MSGILLSQIEDIVVDLNEGIELFERDRIYMIRVFGQKAKFDELSEEELELLVYLLEDASWVLDHLQQKLSKLQTDKQQHTQHTHVETKMSAM